jgi:hypothetical protein
VTGGAYQLALPAANRQYLRPAALFQREDVRTDVEVTADARVLQGEQYAIGVACRMVPSDKTYYAGRVFSDGTSAVVRRPKGQEETVLRSGKSDPAQLGLRRPVRLTLTCTEKNGAMHLELAVNGTVTVKADDPKPLPENPPGIYVATGLLSPQTTFVYDDFTVTPR